MFSPVNNIKKSLLTINFHTCFKIFKNCRSNSGRIFPIFFCVQKTACITWLRLYIYIVMKSKWHHIIVMTSNLSEVIPVYEFYSSFPTCCPELPRTLLRQNLCYILKFWSMKNLIYNLYSIADLYLWVPIRGDGYKGGSN